MVRWVSPEMNPQEVDPAAQNEVAEGENDRDLIDMMNELQSKLIANGFSLDIDLPQIAVAVGSQSAEKAVSLRTSLEREFLPREYAIFGHKEDEKFTDFKAVKEEIAASQMPERLNFSLCAHRTQDLLAER
ncbi:dynamin-2 [Caerostris extrusa]|uniref:Dynamin-2 n=1 Tax=Caerostris extrusa TaxID=172846 RepID=A0AAV4N7G4_CAEEX|nr:dynamin-2 [Caerostris extrusa]